jgi:putative SOS response-associated peptidase YedK
MCSRFELKSTPKEIAKRFDLPMNLKIPNTGECRPTDKVLVITSQGPKIMSWGLKVNWSSKPLINARFETLRSKKTFSSLIEDRCLIPASAYFEWRKDGQNKFKNRIAICNNETFTSLFSFAGLYDGERFAIITCPPAESISHIHDRMPVIINNESEDLWVKLGNSFETASNVLAPYQTDKLNAEEFLTMNSPQTDLFSPYKP